ncbi:toxin-antitoxin system YwqK family antitoxin [Ekhidna sp.]
MLRNGAYIVIYFLTFCLQGQIKQGKYYFDLDSSKISEIYHYAEEDSALQGSYESFYLNGSLKSYGWFEKNQPDSVWTYYYENGRKKALGKFKKSLPSGSWSYYYENGNIKSEGKLQGTSKEGPWKFYYENDGEKSSGNYIKNKKTGIWNYFFEDGSIKAQSIIEKDIGQYTEFYPSGSRRMEGKNENEKSIGEWIYYYESGEIEAVGTFEKGLKTAEWKYYHKNGTIAGTGNYEKGVRTGEWKYYHQNGNPNQSGRIVNDQKDGYWKLFYPSGEVLGEVNYTQGTGKFTEYYPSGSLKSSGAIENEKKTGIWHYYSEKGSLEGKASLIEGSGDYTGYYPDGTIKMKGKIENDKRVGQWKLYNPDGTFAGTYQPIYEDKTPIFKTRISNDQIEKESLEKPNYHPEKRGLRYFLPRVNEYKGVIIATNPIWLLDDQLPISFEYYIQERLGYELQFDIIRSPFFTSDSDIGDYQVYRRGAKIHFKQKFYHADSKMGMFYFGHEVNFKYQNSNVNHTDTLIIQQPRRFGTLREQSFGYGIIVGNRWMKDVGASGLTVDAFIGFGISVRSFNKQYEPIQVLDNYFDQEIKSSVHFPIIIGLNIGFALTKSKSKTQ